ncbi:MAG: ribonuclease E/G [Lachnospiraceae bacterium]|nr:ribonuclease E/G [Lachnospiraceae bacterium]
MIRSGVCITEFMGKTVAWLDVDGKMQQLSVTDDDSGLVGNIYVGKVKNIVKNLGACFVEFGDMTGFLPMSETYGTEKIHEGDCIAVQVVKDASRNKDASLTMKLCLTGKYCIMEYSDPIVSISRKITGEMRNTLKDRLKGISGYSVIIRTSCADPDSIEELIKEIGDKETLMDDILSRSKTRTAGTLLYESEPEYERFILGLNEPFERLITDIPSVCDRLGAYGALLYTDEYPLSKLYSLETKIGELLSRQIWLKSGGSLIIQYTEAMTVIDVNTAKSASKKDKQEYIFDINAEAAAEIARQLRLRNISGIIIVDFINMTGKEYIKRLIEVMKKEIRKDKNCEFVDITKLGLAEIIRKKTTKPVYESFDRNDFKAL